MNNTLSFDFQTAHEGDGQTRARIGEVEILDPSPVRALQTAFRQTLARFAATFKEDYVPAATFSFHPADGEAVPDETEYLMGSSAMKTRLMESLERSRAREAFRESDEAAGA